MRINLNFKDATITKISESEFRIAFDLSKMIKPRLSVDARMYIEHFNLPEFIDDKWGRNLGNLYGYFELRGDNIDSNDFDSEYGNTGNTILYTSPLNNFGTFTNNDPMFISNFKINQNFLRDRLVFTLKIYDKNGDPFTRSFERTEEVDTTTPEYTTYTNKVNDLVDLQRDLEDAKTTLQLVETRTKQQKTQKTALYVTLQEKRIKLFYVLDKILNDGRVGVVQKVKAQALKILLENESVNTFVYLFEIFLPVQRVNDPYKSILMELNVFYTAWVAYTNKLHQIQQSEDNITNINSTDVGIWYETISEFDPNNICVKAEKLIDKDYVVDVPGGTDKTGKVSIQFFQSLIHKSTENIVNNVKPDAGTDNDLVAGDVLIVDKAAFKSALLDKSEYFFIKNSSAQVPKVSISANANTARFSLKVTRDGANYTYEFTNDVATKGLAVGDTITVLGSALDGVDTTNDLEITINGVIVPPLTQTFQFPNYTDDKHTDNGSLSFDIFRDNRLGTYAFDGTPDYTKTKNYNVTETIVVPGDKLDGESPTHDLTLTVDSIIVAETPYPLDDTTVTHSIPPTTINSSNSKVVNSAGVENTAAKDYSFIMTSSNGTYEVNFIGATDGSTGINQDDRIVIQGSKLTGEDGTNDVNVHVQAVTAAGKIDTLDIDTTNTYVARSVSSFKLDVNVKANDTDYEILIKSGSGYVVGDLLTIEGDKVGGASGANDIEIKVTEIKVNDAGKNEINKFEVSGTAAADVGDIGQIKTATISGSPRIQTADGSWINADTSKTSGTPIDTSSIVMPDLKITLKKVQEKGITKIENEITGKYTEIGTAKAALSSTKKTYYLDLNNQLDKLKCMNMSLVLYDEIPEYTQSSADAIKGNTYSRINGCQFKRI